MKAKRKVILGVVTLLLILLSAAKLNAEVLNVGAPVAGPSSENAILTLMTVFPTSVIPSLTLMTIFPTTASPSLTLMTLFPSPSLTLMTIFPTTPLPTTTGPPPTLTSPPPTTPLGPPFDFAISLSPPSFTTVQGGVAYYQIMLLYSDIYYAGTPINIQVVGLGPGMTSQVSTGGLLAISTSTGTPPQAYPFTVIGSAFGLIRQTNGVLVVTTQAPAFDYSVAITPSTLTAELGKTASYMVIVSLVSGTGQPVALNLAGLPADIKYSFSMMSGTPPYSSTLTLDLSSATSAGTYNMIVTGSGAGQAKTASATLITEKTADFLISVAPADRRIRQGESTSLSVIVNNLGQFNDIVTLTMSGLPSGASPSFNPASGKPPFTAALTISTTQSIPVGTYTARIDASGGGKSHSAEVTIIVEAAAVSPSSFVDSLLANPLNLLLIIIVILLAVLILRSSRRGTKVTSQRPETQTGTS